MRVLLGAVGAAIFLVLLVPIVLLVAIAFGPIVVMLLFAVACALGVFILWNIPIALVALGHSIERSAKSHHARHG